ncbi:MAG TPA: four helix bundle protein [Saprospiraceae bacterium]|nr:four helix bundle protein [Saprospiraceae bacterium]
MKHVLRDKSLSFAVEVIILGQEMVKSNEFVLSRQLVRSGTAVGALIREARFAESSADYLHKLSISLKEANETDYWLDLICKTYPVWNQKANCLKKLCNELIAMLVAATKTLKEKRLKNKL